MSPLKYWDTVQRPSSFRLQLRAGTRTTNMLSLQVWVWLSSRDSFVGAIYVEKLTSAKHLRG